MTSLGLPTDVMTFLRHMQSYKDFIKWNIGESSHKVTLTLSWSFQKDKDAPSLREQLLGKLTKTLSLTQTAHNETYVPPDVTALIETLPKKNKRTRLKQRISTTLGAIRNTLSLSQTSIDRTDSFIYPRMPNNVNHVPRTSKPPLMRNNSFHGYVSHHTPKTTSLPYSSPTRSTECSWQAGSSEAETCYSADELDYLGSGDLLCFPAGFVYAAPRSPSQSRAILAYRSTPDIDQSLPDDFMDNTCADVRHRQRQVRHDPDRNVLDWSKIVTGRCSRPNYFTRGLNRDGAKHSAQPPVVTTNFFAPTVVSTNAFPPHMVSTNSVPRLIGSTNSFPSPPVVRSFPPPLPINGQSQSNFPPPPPPNGEAQGNAQSREGTVIRCLDSCEKILNRYETEIT